MGWYGNYEHPNDVVYEKTSGAIRNGITILDTKTTKNWGAVLYKTKEDRVSIDYFIFRDDMYKPLDWTEGMNVIPSKWMTMALPFSSEYERENYENYKEEIRKKKNAPKLEDVLKPGKKYLVWGKHEATYSHKFKQSHVFILEGEGATRFTKLQVEDVKLLD